MTHPAFTEYDPAAAQNRRIADPSIDMVIHKISSLNATMQGFETKIDKLGEAVSKLVLVEERQTNQTTRLDKHDVTIAAMQENLIRIHSRIDKYTYLASGAVFVIGALFELARFIFKA